MEKYRCVNYNYLNLPTEIIFENNTNKKITYLYNAQGIKVDKKVNSNSTTADQTQYLAGYQYLNTALEFFPHAEGYVNANKNSNGEVSFAYVYNYTDHLGNIRLSYTQDPTDDRLKVLEENNYYPFGLKHNAYNTVAKDFIWHHIGIGEEEPMITITQNPTYKYKYNGKEYQDELNLNLYDYGARNYDASIGRWMNVDPLAGKYLSASPYNYCLNNPIIFTDPDGQELILGDLTNKKNRTQKEVDAYKAFVMFAQTEEGQAFLSNYAKKGQKIMYGGEVIFEAKKDGKYHTKDVDLKYSLNKDESGGSTSASGIIKKEGDRITVIVRFSTNPFQTNGNEINQKSKSSGNIFSMVEQITHESLLHADSNADDRLDDNYDNNSNLPKYYRPFENHGDHYYESDKYLGLTSGTSIFGTKGLKILEKTNKELKLGIAINVIKNEMWTFKGSLVDVNKKTGKATRTK